MPVWNSRRCEFSQVNTPSLSKRDWLQTFLVKVSFIFMRIENYFHISGFALASLWNRGFEHFVMKISDKKSRRFDLNVSVFRDRNVVPFYRLFLSQNIYPRNFPSRFELFDVISIVDKRIDHETLMSSCWISNNPIKQDWDHAHTVPYI